MKKVLSIVLISICALYLNACTTIIPTLPIINNAVNNNIDPSSILNSKNSSYKVKINQKYLSNEKDGRTYLKSEYPFITIEGMNDNTAFLDTINNINKNQEKEAKDFMANTDESAISLLFESDLYDKNTYFTQESKTNVERSDSKLLVLHHQVYYDAGGAHPSTNSVFTNIYIPTGKELKIDDVVVDKNSFYDTLKIELKKQNPDYGFREDWENNIDTYKKGYIDLNEGNEDGEELRYEVTLNFMLLDGILNVYFNPYELGPYASGGIGVNLPYSEFKGLVKDEYQ